MVNDPQQPRPSGDAGPIVALIAAFVVLDLITPSLLRWSEPSEFLPAALTGAIAGQFGLLAVWGVLGPQRLLARGCVTLLVAVLFYWVFCLGVVMAGGSEAQFARSVLLLPLLLLAAQLPLWILRAVTGCHIVLAGTQRPLSRAESRQFRLQHILGATTAVAVALGLARLGIPDFGNAGANADPSVWLGLMLACLACSVWSAFPILPCLWAAFVARNKAAGITVIAVYAALMSFLVLVIVSAIAGLPPDIGQEAWYLVLFPGALACVLLGGLHVARSCGYVLVRPGRLQPPSTPTDPSTGADLTGPSLPPQS